MPNQTYNENGKIYNTIRSRLSRASCLKYYIILYIILVMILRHIRIKYGISYMIILLLFIYVQYTIILIFNIIHLLINLFEHNLSQNYIIVLTYFFNVLNVLM